MATGNSIKDEIKANRKEAFAKMNGVQKTKYLIHYYKIHAIVAIAIIGIIYALVHTIANHRDIYFDAAIVNGNQEADYETFIAEYDATLDYNRDKEKVSVDSSYVMSMDPSMQNGFDAQQMEKLMVATVAGQIDVIIADEDTFRGIAANGYFIDLSSAMSDELLAKYSDRFITCDIYYDDVKTSTESSGVEVTDAAKILQYNIFPDKKCYLGIVLEEETPDRSFDFLDYLFITEDGGQK